MLCKFINSEKATKFCEIFLLILTTVHAVKSKGKISQNFVAFSEYINFKKVEKNILIISDFLEREKLTDKKLSNFEKLQFLNI